MDNNLIDNTMTTQDNTEENLRYLVTNDLITLGEYFFRQGANQLNINTYKQDDNN